MKRLSEGKDSSKYIFPQCAFGANAIREMVMAIWEREGEVSKILQSRGGLLQMQMKAMVRLKVFKTQAAAQAHHLHHLWKRSKCMQTTFTQVSLKFYLKTLSNKKNIHCLPVLLHCNFPEDLSHNAVKFKFIAHYSSWYSIRWLGKKQ